MSRLYASLLLASAVGCVRGPPGERAPDLRAARCLGPEDATAFAVYLHGFDDPLVSAQELHNRESLSHVAQALSLRIALPRSSQRCPAGTGALCWGWALTDSDLSAAVDAVQSAARDCFGERPYGLIGFSNGGYLLSKLHRTCQLHHRLPSATWAVTVGSSVFKGPLEYRPESLAGCGPLVLLSGTGDAFNSDPSEHLFHALQAKGADVQSVHFDGGHLVPEEPTRAVLKELIGRP